MSSDQKSNTPARPNSFNVTRHESKKKVQNLDPNAIKRFIIGIAQK